MVTEQKKKGRPFTNKLVVHFAVPASLLTWQEYGPVFENPTA